MAHGQKKCMSKAFAPKRHLYAMKKTYNMADTAYGLVV